MKVLNLYAGIGGNRKLWQDVQVTAVEKDEKIAAVYQKLHPNDTVFVGDAHRFLQQNYAAFDFIWSSPPCYTHTSMVKATRHKKARRFPDFRLYEEVVFLQHFAEGLWVVENVDPYYTPLISAKKIDRHLFWSNFPIPQLSVPAPGNLMKTDGPAGRQKLMDWLGIHFTEKLYCNGGHSLTQVLRNCVHPQLGEHVLSAARGIMARLNGQGKTHLLNF